MKETNEFGVSRRIGKTVLTGIIPHEHKTKFTPEELKEICDPSDKDWLEAKKRITRKSS